MKNSFLLCFLIVSLFLFNFSSEPVNASTEPIPKISANIFYPDTCSPEFWVVFEIANLGSASNYNSTLSITLSLHLDFVSWSTKPDDPDMMIRIYDVGETKLDIFHKTFICSIQRFKKPVGDG